MTHPAGFSGELFGNYYHTALVLTFTTNIFSNFILTQKVETENPEKGASAQNMY